MLIAIKGEMEKKNCRCTKKTKFVCYKFVYVISHPFLYVI